LTNKYSDNRQTYLLTTLDQEGTENSNNFRGASICGEAYRASRRGGACADMRSAKAICRTATTRTAASAAAWPTAEVVDTAQQHLIALLPTAWVRDTLRRRWVTARSDRDSAAILGGVTRQVIPTLPSNPHRIPTPFLRLQQRCRVVFTCMEAIAKLRSKNGGHL